MILDTHAHTNHSDGEHPASYVLERAKEAGADSVITTDHAEMLDKDSLSMRLFNYSLAPQNLLTWNKIVGFWPWFDDLHSLGMTKGLEVGLGEKRTSHVLYMGGNDMIAANVLYRGCKESNAFSYVYGASNLESCEKKVGKVGPEEIAQKLKRIADASGAVLVAAHPLSPKYPFTIGTQLVDAVEVFDPSPVCFNREWGLPVLKELAKFSNGQKPLALVSGSDYHGESTDRLGLQHENVFPSLRRHTIFPELSSKDAGNGYMIASHIRQRKCYATLGDARIKSMTVWPGGTFAPTNATTPFRVEFTNAKANLGNDSYIVYTKVGEPSTIATLIISDKRRSSGTLQVNFGKLMPEQGTYFVYMMIKGQIATSAIVYENKAVPQPVSKPAPPKAGSDGGKSVGRVLTDLLTDLVKQPAQPPKNRVGQPQQVPAITIGNSTRPSLQGMVEYDRFYGDKLDPNSVSLRYWGKVPEIGELAYSGVLELKVPGGSPRYFQCRFSDEKNWYIFGSREPGTNYQLFPVVINNQQGYCREMWIRGVCNMIWVTIFTKQDADGAKFYIPH